MTQLQAARRIGQILNRHPAVGFALGVHAHGHWEFACDGYADLDAGSPITERTVFRIASVTKTMTAIAVMQLAERGLIELDAPASDYLRAYPLVLRSKGIRQPTIRHLLTHTSGIPDARHLTDLLHFSWGPWDGRPPIFSVPYGAPLPSLARHYRNGLEVVADPGTAFAYSNPGFATLGQIVEDVSGLPLDRYLRERVFEPLGLADTDLRRNPRLSARLATGYTFHRRGPGPVPDREWIGAGGGGAYSTLWDLAAYADALLGGGANGHGRVLESETLAQMFERQYQASPTLGAVGLAFFRTDVDGHPILSHDGILPGFNTHLAVAPDDGVAVIALTNGSAGAMRWLPAEMDALLREVVGVGAQDPPRDVPHRPEVWGQLCGRYGLPAPGDLRGRLAMAGGLEVFISGGRPMLRLRLPVPALRRGLPLQPVDRDDPRAFRLDLSPFGLGAVQLRFRQDPETGRRLMHTDLGGQPITLVERRSSRRPRAAIERLGFEDRLMLRMSRAWPQDIGALAILDGATLFDQAGEFGLNAVRSAVEARLHLVPRLRQRIRIPRRGRGGPYWTDAPAFDLARHVRELRLEPPASETQLLQAVEALRSQRFERRHPLWGMWFLTGLPDGQVAMFVKLHHTIGDGLAAMTILSTFLDSEPSGPSTAPAPWHARPAPSPSELVADTIRRRLASLGHGLALLARPGRVVRDLWAAWPAVRELLADQPGDRTSVDRIVGQGRRLALARTSYRTVRRVGRANGASVNDVLLAATAAGIRRLLLSRGEPADGVTVRAYVPVSLRRRLRGPQQGNEIGQMAVPLELGAATPLGRLRRIAGETHARKARRRPNLGSLVRGRMVSWLLLRLIIAQRVNVTTASIPGPRRQAFFASAPVLAVYPVLPLVGNQPIGVGAVSYAGKLGFGIAVDRDAVPDIDVLAAGLQDELEALGAEGGAAPREPGATVLQGLRR